MGVAVFFCMKAGVRVCEVFDDGADRLRVGRLLLMTVKLLLLLFGAKVETRHDRLEAWREASATNKLFS